METKGIIITERIKIFLKIKSSINNNKNKSYLIQNNTLQINDPKLMNTSNEKFEFDKIFSDKNENSYIYEEIVRNSIKETLSGNNFSFISYGTSKIENKEIIFGKNDCYQNINNRGIFPRFLENIISKISTNKNLYDNLILNLSFLMINENKFVDLSNFYGLDSKKIASLTVNDILNKYLIDINKNNNIKKIPCENYKDALYFLTKLFEKFQNLEIQNNQFFNNSNYAFIINLNDNNGKLISNINFIILGSNNNKNQNFLTELNKIKQDIISTINNKDNKNKNQSNLFFITEKDNIKKQYRIIGNFSPDIDLFSDIKDTIEFLTNCKKIKNKDSKIFFSDNNQKIKITKKIKKENNYKDLKIKELELQIQKEEKRLKDLTDLVDHNQKKYEALKENYKFQIESLMEQFNFKGDLNKLMENNYESKEKKYTLKVREAMENNKLFEFRKQKLLDRINFITQETKKIQNIEDIKKTDEALIKLNTEFKEKKLAYENEIKLRNEHSHNIEVLKEKNKILNQLLNKYKQENDNKNNIIKTLPNIFVEDLKFQNKVDDGLNKIKNDLVKKFRKEIKAIQMNNEKEKDILSNKYENLINQKVNELKKMDNEIIDLNKKLKNYDKDYIKEIINLYQIIDELITNYKKCFNQKKKFTSDIKDIRNFAVFINLKEEFDNIIEKFENNVNRFKYPILFNYLDEQGIERKKTKIVVYKIKEKERKKNFLALENKLSDKYIPNEILLKKKEHIFNNDIIISNEKFEKMDKNDLLQYYKSIKEKIYEIEEFNSKFIDYKNMINKNDFKTTEETFNNLKKRIENYRKTIDEYHSKTNRAKTIQSSNEKIIKSLNMENITLNRKLNNKKINDKISYPILSNTSSDWKVNLFKNSKLNLNNVTHYKLGNIFDDKIISKSTKNSNNKLSFNNPYYRFPES